MSFIERASLLARIVATTAYLFTSGPFSIALAVALYDVAVPSWQAFAFGPITFAIFATLALLCYIVVDLMVGGTGPDRRASVINWWTLTAIASSAGSPAMSARLLALGPVCRSTRPDSSRCAVASIGRPGHRVLHRIGAYVHRSRGARLGTIAPAHDRQTAIQLGDWRDRFLCSYRAHLRFDRQLARSVSSAIELMLAESFIPLSVGQAAAISTLVSLSYLLVYSVIHLITALAPRPAPVAFVDTTEACSPEKGLIDPPASAVLRSVVVDHDEEIPPAPIRDIRWLLYGPECRAVVRSTPAGLFNMPWERSPETDPKRPVQSTEPGPAEPRLAVLRLPGQDRRTERQRSNAERLKAGIPDLADAQDRNFCQSAPTLETNDVST